MFSSTKSDTLGGNIYSYNSESHSKSLEKEWMEMTKKMSKMEDKEKDISKITGSWLKNLAFDGVDYWNIDMAGKETV